MSVPAEQLPVESQPVGRPPLYEDWMPQVAAVIGRLGGTQPDLADAFGVSLRTVERWMAEGAEFWRAVKLAQGDLDRMVERSLFERAMGYEHESEEIFHNKDTGVVRAQTRKKYAPDTAAAIFWLKNRKPEKWRDKVEVDANVNSSGNMDAYAITDGLVALANAHPITALPLRNLLQSALDRIVIPEGG